MAQYKTKTEQKIQLAALKSFKSHTYFKITIQSYSKIQVCKQQNFYKATSIFELMNTLALPKREWQQPGVHTNETAHVRDLVVQQFFHFSESIWISILV